jgi:Ni/Co efflux regulator RcnB
MKKWFFAGLFALAATAANAETNTTNDTNTTRAPRETNATSVVQTAKHVEEQMKREEHFAKTQSFAQGDDYNLTEHQIDPKDLENIQVDPPMYDFNMDDVYD